MSCVCGHREHDHSPLGQCRVPDCPCQQFEPGNTGPFACRTRQPVGYVVPLTGCGVCSRSEERLDIV